MRPAAGAHGQIDGSLLRRFALSPDEWQISKSGLRAHSLSKSRLKASKILPQKLCGQ